MRHMIRRILQAVDSRKSFLCSSHTRADGDGLGSALAFNRLLRKMGKRSHVVCEFGAIPEYRFIPDADRVGASPKDLRPAYDAVLTFDCANYDRLGSIGEALPKELFRINIDHHVSNSRFGHLNWVDADFASTTEMVYTFARENKIRLDKTLATQIYVGLVSDTGHFSMSNTSIRSHEIAADLLRIGVKPIRVTEQLYRQKSLGQLRLLSRFIESIQLSENGRVGWARLTNRMARECGYYPYETQEFVNSIKCIKGVQVAVLLRELEEDSRIKVSWRTAADVDGAKLAAQFGGGGHKRASGALIPGTLDDVERRVIGKTIEWTMCKST